MFDRLKRVVAPLPRRAWLWLKSPRGRIVWSRLLAAVLVVVCSPYLAVVWTIMFVQGSMSDRMVVIMVAGVLLAARSMRRALKSSPKPSESKPAASARSKRRKNR